MKMECDYLNSWIKKNGHICKNFTQNGEPQRNSWEKQKKKMVNPRQSWVTRRRRRMVNPRDIAGERDGEEW